MAANTSPIFTKTPVASWSTAITAANTAMDGTGTVTTVFTADATNGSYVRRLILKSAGTNVATVVRVFLNNGSTNTTASNNVLIAEVGLAATTASNSSPTIGADLVLDMQIPAGYKINVTLGTAVSAGWIPCVIGGNY